MKTTFGTTEQAVICLSHWLKTAFKEYTDKDLTISVVRNKDDMRSFGSMQPSQTNKPSINFPFLRLAYATYVLDTTRGGGKKHLSIAIGKDDNGKTQMLSLLPIKLGIGAKLQTDNIEDVLRFCHMLSRNYPAVGYDLEYETGFKTSVKINFENQFTVAEANLSSPGDSFDWETTFIIDLMDGDLSTMPSIKTIKINMYQSNGVGKTVAEAEIDLIDTLNLKFPDIYNKQNTPYVGEYDATNSKL